jgi:ribokinase
VDVSACVVDAKLPTGASVVLSGTNDRATLTAMGSIGETDVGAIPEWLLNGVRHVHIGAYFLQRRSRPILPHFLAGLRARGITTSLDTNWDPEDRWDDDVVMALGASDIFFPNAAEACRLARIDDPEAAARTLARQGAAGRDDEGPLVAVKLGAAGAVACRARGPFVRVPGYPVEVVETTGSGDSFNAGFLRAWLRGADLTTCLRWGAICGALAATGVGGVSAQPTAEMVEAAATTWQGMATVRP